MIINVSDFVKKKGIIFKNPTQEIKWIRKLRPDTLLKIGESYFADEVELNQLFKSYVSNETTKQKRLRAQRAKQAKKNFGKKLSFQQQLGNK